MDLNKVMLIGRVTQDPEVRTTPNGTAVANFSIATNLVWVDKQGQRQDKAEFHNIVAWRKLAEICGQYLRKGSKIYLEGRLETRSWEDQAGVRKYRTEVIADNMIMLDRKGDTTGGNVSYEAPLPQETPAINSPVSRGESTEEEINVEDIPF
ncbi:MAG: single-stranded DNA-binding protein [Candidatus Komeilibacteria bacterium]|nr:single-stranded DNA-binding protein [Candidatus Komeilibacteria bacterium]